MKLPTTLIAIFLLSTFVVDSSFAQPPQGGFQGGRGGEPTGPRIPPEDLDFLDGIDHIADLETFQELSYQGTQVMIDVNLKDWQFVKFQIEDVEKGEPIVYFINTKTHRAHPKFMQVVNIAHGEGSMRGVLVYRPLLKAPNGQPGLYTFEFEPNDNYPYDQIKIAFDKLLEKAPVLKGRLAYTPRPRAEMRFYAEEKQYTDGKLPVLLESEFYEDIAFLPLNVSGSYGFLRVMDLQERPSPRDIVIYKTLPNEMPRVGGIITEVRQTPLSHVNLRAIQDNVPNAYIVDAANSPRIKPLIGKNVFYRVTDKGFELREATTKEIEQHYADLRPDEPQMPIRDLSAKTIRSLDAIAFEDSKSVGVKAANVATMRTFGFEDGMIPDGYAIPFYFYDEFMKHNGFYDQAKMLIDSPEFHQDRDRQDAELKKFRSLIKKGKMPQWMLDQLDEVHQKFPAGSSVRCRSSTNNEDLPGFSGAGLYDSFTHHADEGHFSKSVMQVFASLWNYRAFEEREFYRIDHFAAAMGVLLHPNFSDEVANGVAVTDDVLYLTKGNYYVNSQVGEDLVTNPEEQSVPEEVLLDWWDVKKKQVMQTSNRVQPSEQVVSDDQLDQISKALAKIHGRFAKLYGVADDAPFAMEIEFKVTRKGKLAIKQARPWVY
ncbi:MAG: PEP/pyruvate-binding domain-containing protein [Pirellulaceae bacterium]